MSLGDPRGRQVLLACLLLFAMTAFLYSGVRRNGFITFDDGLYIYENPHVQRGLTGQALKWSFTTFWASNWHPLTWISHSLDCRFYGLDPRGHHLTSVALHALNAVVLFAALHRMTVALVPSAFVAALFAVHPLRVESVAWAAERKEVLAGLFWMTTLWLYARYSERPGAGRYAAVVISFACGLMAKPTLVSLPCVLLLLDVWPLGRLHDAERRRRRVLLLEKLPMLALSAAAGVMTLLSQSGGGALVHVPFVYRAANALVSYVLYVLKFLWPAHLAVFYPHPAAMGFRPGAAFVATAVVSALALAGVTIVAVRSFRARPYGAVGWLWYLVTMLPMSGLIQVGRQGMADRYVYLPAIGLGIVLAWGARDVARRYARWRWPIIVAAAVVLASFAGLTRLQIERWRDSETLYRHALEVTRDNYLTHNNLGAVLQQRGALAEAEREYERALEIAPEFADANVNLGTVYLARGDSARAEQRFLRGLRFQPDHRNASYHLGLLRAARGDLAGAVEQYERALEVDPEFAKAHTNLGVLRMRQGNAAAAAHHFERALAADPRHVSALLNLASLLARQGKLEAAAARFEQGLSLAPNDAKANAELVAVLGALAASHADAGRWDDAVAAAKRALALASRWGRPALAADVEARLAAYRSRQPYRPVP